MKNSTFSIRPALVSAGLLAMLAAPLLAGAAYAQGQPHPPASQNQPLPQPRIIVIDRQAILRASKVGMDIVRQVNAYTQSAESEFKAENDGLQKEQQDLQEQVAILAPDVRAQKIKAFQSKQAAFRNKVENRQGEIQGGVMQARQEVERALGPILQGIMQERGANLMLDRAAVVLGTVDVDVTRTAIQRLDQRLPSVKVQLISLPPGAQMQMAPR